MPRKQDIKQVDDVCRRLQMTQLEAQAFRRHLHEEKERGRGGSFNARGDFTFAELLNEGRNFLEEERRP